MIQREWKFNADGTIDITVGSFKGCLNRQTDKFIIGKDGKMVTYDRPTCSEMDRILTNLENIENNGK